MLSAMIFSGSMVLIGYFAYDYDNQTVKIPNEKWDKKVDAAIEQIKRKEYCQSLKEYQGNILLVGINYNKRTKKHQCIIEEYQKS